MRLRICAIYVRSTTTTRKIYRVITYNKCICTICRMYFTTDARALFWFVQVYTHGENVLVTICIRNSSNKTVKKIKVLMQQVVDIVIFQNGQCRTTIAAAETQWVYTRVFTRYLRQTGMVYYNMVLYIGTGSGGGWIPRPSNFRGPFLPHSKYFNC